MATYTQTISAAANCVYWDRSGTTFANDGVISGNWGATYDSSMRFTSCPVGKAHTIISATLSLTFNVLATATNVLLYGDDSDNPSAPTNYTQGRAITKTTASKNPGTFTLNTKKDIDVKNIVEEIFQRAGRVVNDAFQLVLVDNGCTSAYNQANLIVYGSRVSIEIVYSEGGRNNAMLF
jgi:hypothetical protein